MDKVRPYEVADSFIARLDSLEGIAQEMAEILRQQRQLPLRQEPCHH